MKKLSSLVDYTTDSNFPEASINAAKNSMRTNLEKTNINQVYAEYKKQSKVSNICFALFFLVIPLFVGLIWYSSKVAPIKAQWYSIVNSSISQPQVYKDLMENKHDNVKVIGMSKPQGVAIAKIYRSKDIPSDATIYADFGGMDFSLNSRILSTRRITWRWIRTYSDGKRTYTKTYYKDNFYTFSFDFDDRWNDFEFKLAQGSLFNRKGKELENEKFNKGFSYEYNDPIKLRVLLTPLIQETFVNEFSKTTAASSTVFYKQKDHYVLVKTLNHTPFTLDVRMTPDIDHIISTALNDMNSDASYVLENIATLSTFRELVK